VQMSYAKTFYGCRARPVSNILCWADYHISQQKVVRISIGTRHNSSPRANRNAHYRVVPCGAGNSSNSQSTCCPQLAALREQKMPSPFLLESTTKSNSKKNGKNSIPNTFLLSSFPFFISAWSSNAKK